MTLVRSGNKFKHSSTLDLAVAFGRFLILGNFGCHINCSEGVYVKPLDPVDLVQQCLLLISSSCLVV